MDRKTDGESNTLATCGLEEPFFPVVLLCQFSVLAGNSFWFYILLMYLEYHTVVQLMWLSGRPMLFVAEVRGSIPAKHRGWSRR